jgi:hypothetical protein
MIQGITEDEWRRVVSGPAGEAAEGKRRFDCGAAKAEYQTALLPDGRWAIRFTCAIQSGSGMSCPWRRFATREECLAYFQQEVLAFFERERRLQRDREKARQQIMAVLRGSMFGFEEPEPEGA